MPQPRFPSTDILGALLLASQIFNQEPPSRERRVLVILSDMRNHTRDLNLDSLSDAHDDFFIGKASTVGHADLARVQVYVLGVDGAGKSTYYWQALERFWKGYFRRSGASLNSFSVLRELPPIPAARQVGF
jgi:hypothetical protein